VCVCVRECVMCYTILIIRFSFQCFQNSMREDKLLFIMTKILRKQFKKPHQYINENFVNIYMKIHAVLNCHTMKICGIYKMETGI